MRKEGPEISFFYYFPHHSFPINISPYVGQRWLQLIWLCCCICNIIAWAYNGKRLVVWLVVNSYIATESYWPFKFTPFWLSYSWVSTGADGLKTTLNIIRGSLTSLYMSRPPRNKKDLQVDNNISLKAVGVVFSGLYWGILEAVLLEA